jgi:uncharacterized membrane protein YdbT with pleckstrin-like domain
MYQQHPDWLYFSGLFLVAGGALIVALRAGSLMVGFVAIVSLILLASYGRYRRLYTVTDQRVIMRTGLIARNTNEMDIRHIRGINVRQNATERLLGIGSLEIISAADGGAEVIFNGIRDPFGVKDRIRALRPPP